MYSKNDNYYFDNFEECADIAYNSAVMLLNNLQKFNADSLSGMIESQHEMEHMGDMKKHEMISVLVKAFITPIERDDIIKLSHNIDNVTDSIEDILIHIYMNGVKEIRDDGIAFARIIVQCCETMKKLMNEFRNFKKSKTLEGLIIELNRLEEVGDKMYIDCMKDLHSNSSDPLTIIAWHEIYHFFEKSCDACEDVADIVESITIANM